MVPVRLAAAGLVLVRASQRRWDEARAYAWLAGAWPGAPTSSSAQHAGDFNTTDYFEKFEDEAYPVYIDSNVRLVRWVTPDTSVPVCDFGCGRGFLLRDLQERGYTDTVGFEISRVAVERAVAPGVRLFPGFQEIDDRQYNTLCLISVLEHIEPDEVDRFLASIARITAEKIVCCIPIYPGNLMDFYRRDLTHRILARRSWWDARFSEVGFVPAPLPNGPLPYIQPFAYERRPSES